VTKTPKKSNLKGGKELLILFMVSEGSVHYGRRAWQSKAVYTRHGKQEVEELYALCFFASQSIFFFLNFCF
jgi:hypothetical protein